MESMVVMQVPIKYRFVYHKISCLLNIFGKYFSHSCGGGTRMKTRQCPVSPFRYGKNPCGDGQSEVTEGCNQNPCLPDPEWTPWGKILNVYHFCIN